MQRVLVLGVEHPRAVAVLQSLGRLGISVAAVDHDASARGFHSRYAREHHLIPEDSDSALAAIESLSPVAGGVLIPTNDHYLGLVARNFQRLSSRFVPGTPPWSVLEPMVNKAQCYTLAREIGICTPEFFVPRDGPDLERILEGLDFERNAYLLSIVDVTTPEPADARTRRFVRVAGSNVAEVRQACLDIRARTGAYPMVMRVIPGEADRCTGVTLVVGRNHEPIVGYTVKRLQMYPYARDRAYTHPYELGANVFCESVHDREALDAATRLVRHARYWGVITFEFRRDARDGRLSVVKADPRVVRATALSRALGCDVPAALYRALTEAQEPVPFVPVRYPERIAWIWLTWYFQTLIENRHRRPIAGELLWLARNVPRIRAWAYGSMRDPLPFLADLWRFLCGWPAEGARWVRRRLVKVGAARSDG